MTSPITSVTCPSHNLSTEKKENSGDNNFFEVSAMFEGTKDDLDRDIVVLIGTEDTNKPKVLVEKAH